MRKIKKDVLAFVFICDKKYASAINHSLQETLPLILFLAFSLKSVKMKLKETFNTPPAQ